VKHVYRHQQLFDERFDAEFFDGDFLDERFDTGLRRRAKRKIAAKLTATDPPSVRMSFPPILGFGRNQTETYMSYEQGKSDAQAGNPPKYTGGDYWTGFVNNGGKY
jgi:hypothetical protein